MAKTGAKGIIWAPYVNAETTTTAATYGEIVSLAELVTANWTPTMASGEQYGDNKKVETSEMVTGGTLALEITDLDASISSQIHGETADEDGVSRNAGSEDVAPFGGVAFYKTGVRNSVGYFEGYFYPKCKAAPAADSATTANSAITFNNDSLSMNVFPLLNSNVYRKVSKRFADEQECIAWCRACFGK